MELIGRHGRMLSALPSDIPVGDGTTARIGSKQRRAVASARVLESRHVHSGSEIKELAGDSELEGGRLTNIFNSNNRVWDDKRFGTLAFTQQLQTNNVQRLDNQPWSYAGFISALGKRVGAFYLCQISFALSDRTQQSPQTKTANHELSQGDYNSPPSPLRRIPLDGQVILVALLLAGGGYYLHDAFTKDSSVSTGLFYTALGLLGILCGVTASLLIVTGA